VPRGHVVKLATREFTTKRDARAHFQAMLRRYSPGDRVNDEDAKDLASLLERHPQAAEKIGPGIDHFEVMSADYNSQCFWVVRTDETIEQFSYPSCITGKPKKR
jgi:hypothetical protein